MKTILVPIERYEHLGSTLQTAYLMARACGSYIEAFALRLDITSLVAADPFSGVAFAGAEWEDKGAVAESQELFERFMRDRDVPPFADASKGLSFSFNGEAPPGDSFVGSYGRVFDLIVVGQPGAKGGGARMAVLESALFESGRPILIAPPVAPQRLDETVVIAWNGSSETARTIALAMPVLSKARRVHVLAVAGTGVPGPTVDQVRGHLARHGVASEGRAIAPGHRTPGEAILAEAAALGCDLLIKGAYTQSRLRQMIFGGMTSQILADAKMPVFMAH